MGLKEALTELEDVDPKEFASALNDQRSAHYKAIYTEGFGAGKTSVKDDLDGAQEKLSTLESERDKLKQRIEDMEGEQPDVAELRGKYEQKLEDMQVKLQEHEKQVEQVRKASTETLRQKEQRFFQERAKNYLMSQGVEDPDVADIKIQKAIQDGRVQFDDDLNAKVYEPDGEVPTPISDGKQPHEVFGQSLLENIPEKFITDPGPGSTGLGNTDGAGGGKTMRRAEFEKLSPAERKEFATGDGKVVD